jgi:hypothetical protein
MVGMDMAKYERVFAMTFGSIYPLYLQKVEKKGRTEEELDEVLGWLTGYDVDQLVEVIEDGTTLEEFFEHAPELNPNVHLIKGVVCGVRVEEVAHPLMQKIRWMDKLVDELAKGKKMEKILRE